MRQRFPSVRIPTPCAERWAASLPTATGGPRATPRTEAAAGRAARVPAVAPQPHWPGRALGCWALAAALGSWQVAQAQLLASATGPAKPAARPERVVISGVVLDDSLNVPVPGLWLYLNHTKYGAVTNAQGEFTFAFPAGWRPVRGGLLVVRAVPIPFTFKPLQVKLDWRRYDPARPLLLRLASAPGRGRPNLHGAILMAPPVPPPVYPPGSHTGRP